MREFPWRRRVLETSLVAAPLAYGTVHPLPVLLFQLAGFALLGASLAAARQRPGGWDRLRDPLLLTGVAAVAWGLLQLVPLPWFALKAVAPGTAHLLVADPAAHIPVPAWHGAGVVPWFTERSVVWIAAMTAWYGVALLEVRRRADVAAVVRALALAGIVVAVLGIAQKLTGATRIFWIGIERRDFFATFVNPNNAAGLLTLATCACVAAAFRHRRTSPVWLFGGLLTASAAALTLSRGGIGILVFALVLLMAGLRKSDAPARRGLALVTIGAVAFVLWVGATEVVGELATLEKDSGTLNGRTDIWRTTLRMVPDFWLFGVGYGNFESVFPAYFDVPARVRVTAVENEYLHALVEGGIVGAALAGFALIALVRRIRETFRRRGSPTLALAAGIAALLVHMCIDFPLHVGAPALWLGVAAALIRPRDKAASQAVLHGPTPVSTSA